MTNRISVSNYLVATLLLGFAVALPSSAQTGTLTISDGSGNTVTLTTNGTVSGTPVLTCSSCATVSDAFTPTSVIWAGTVGNFTVAAPGLKGQFSSTGGGGFIDVGGTVVNNLSAAGNSSTKLTVTWAVTGFTNGSSSSAVTTSIPTFGGTGNVGVAAYYNSTAALAAAQSFSALSGSVTNYGSGPGSTGTFSMTEVVTFTLQSGAEAANDSGFTIGAPLTLVCPVSTGTVGTPYTGSLTATGGYPPYSFSITAGSLPGGLSLNAMTGAITGTPSGSGPFNFTGQVVDSYGTAAHTLTTQCTIGISTSSSTQPTLKVSCPAVTSGTVGVPISNLSLSATGGTSPYVFSTSTTLNNGTGLPPGLTLTTSGNSAGSISGTPTQAGTYLFTATVIDSTTPTHLTASTAANACNIKITTPPQISFVCPAGTGTVGVPYSSKITASGGTGVYTFSATGLPGGLTLNSSTGAITGTPTSAGTFYLDITIKDSSGNTAIADCHSSCTIVISCSFTGTISGYVYDDLNGSKTYNNGDKAFSGVTVTLTSNGKTWTAVSNSSGYYQFTGLVAGSYKVSAPTNAAGNETLDTPSSINVTLSSSSNSCDCASNNNNFGYVGQSTVSGKCYTNDWWGNSHGMGGQCITISGKDCNGNDVKKTCNTDDNGNYSCSGFIPGSYTVSAPSSCYWQNGNHSIQTNSNYNVSCQSNDQHANLNFCYNYGW